MPTKITAQVVEKNIQNARLLDVQRRELSGFAEENNNLLSAANAQMKIDIRRREAQQQACRTEQKYEEEIRQRQFEQALKAKTTLQNQALATELDRDAAEQERKRREIQRICEESPELKELEKALKIAYLNKERAAQYEEKILLASREQERIQAIEEQMEYDRLNAIKNEQGKQGAKRSMYDDQRVILQKQIQDKQKMLDEARMQTELDRQTVDAIVRKINEEDMNDYRKKKQMQAATSKVMQDFAEQRRREKAAAAAAAKAEEDAIAFYQQSLQSRNEGVAALKQAKKDEEDRILAKIVEETERKRKQEEEFSNLRDMLWEEELEAARAKDAKARVDKQVQMRRDMMDANEKMVKIKTEMRMKEAEQELKMLDIMRKKFADDEAKERRDSEKRAASKDHHISLIEKQKNQRQQMYDAERSQEIAFAEEAERREAYRKQVIQEARKRLLQQHADQLQGFLPKAAFADTH